MKDASDVPAPMRDALPDIAPGPFRHEDVEDDAQEAWLRLIALADAGPDSPRAWLVRVTSNIAIDRWRRARVERDKLARLGGIDEACAATPEAELVRAETCRDAIRALLAGSEPEAVAAVLLHDVFGLSYAEIALVGGRNEAAWRQAVRRALERARARSCARDSAHGEPDPVRGADAVTLRFQRAVLMADPAMLLHVLRVSARGPVAPDGIVGSKLGNHSCVRTRFELDGRGARVSLTLGGVVLCTLPKAMAGGRTATAV